MLVPFPRVLRYLEGAIEGWVMGRHGWIGKTPQIACNLSLYKIQSFVCVLDRQGGNDVSRFERLPADVSGHSIRLPSVHRSLSKRHPFPLPPTGSGAGHPRNFF